MPGKTKLMALLLICCIVALSVGADDQPYFLSMKQKGQLIWSGRIETAPDEVYDIRIVPGYKYPARYSWEHLKDAGGNLGEYFQSDKYEDLWDQGGDCIGWAFEDCLRDFTLKGSGRAWKKYFGKARRHVRKRVFGWWLAYPWALLQSSVDNVVRIPAGLLGTVGGTVSGLAVVPAWHLADSAVKATWNIGVGSVVLPASGLAWNTVAAPPLALLGQRPAPERVDGFWVRAVHDESPPSDEGLAELIRWAELLDVELGSYESARAIIAEEQRKRTAELMAEITRIRQDSNSRQRELNKKIRKRFEQLISNDEHADLLLALQRHKWSQSRLRANANLIRASLQSAGYDEQECRAIYELLTRYQAPVVAIPTSYRAGEKTDPISESIRVIEDLD